LLRAGYTNEQSDAVLMFLERAMALPDEVEAQLEAELAEEGVTMAEMTHRWERRGWERGWERGRDEGRTEGRTEGQRDLILQLLAQQCGPLSATLTEQLGTLPEAELSELGRALLRFNNLADLEAWLAERVPASR
jgi:flagellar biosynthesis/type III secretory pathway protein FliH